MPAMRLPLWLSIIRQSVPRSAGKMMRFMNMPKQACVAQAMHACLGAAPMLVLFGCGNDSQEAFAPACPGAAILRDAADLHRYRDGQRDLIDTELEGRITGINGNCTRDGAATVVTTVQVGIELTRGPAAPGREARLAYFVAVLDGERILDKQVFPLRAEFPPNGDRLRLVGDDVELRLKVTPDKTAAAYRVEVGFQLTPEELEANRAGGRR